MEVESEKEDEDEVELVLELGTLTHIAEVKGERLRVVRGTHDLAQGISGGGKFQGALVEEDVERGVSHEVVSPSHKGSIPDFENYLLDLVEKVRVEVEQTQQRSAVVVSFSEKRSQHSLRVNMFDEGSSECLGFGDLSMDSSCLQSEPFLQHKKELDIENTDLDGVLAESEVW